MTIPAASGLPRRGRATRRTPRSPSPDVVIVGAGIVGTSSAAFLAEAGASVTLVERADIGAGASGRNSGAIQDPFDSALTALHAETLAIYRDLSARDRGFSLPDDAAGLLVLGFEEAPIAGLWRTAQEERPDLEPTLLRGAELQALEPGLARGLHACRLRTGYPVPPAAATTAFADRARAAGARLRLGATASVWHDRGTTHGVHMDGERLPAGSVLVAAGAESAALIDPTGRWRPVQAVWGVNVDVAIAAPLRSVVEQVGVEAVARAGLDDSADPAATGIPSIFSLVTANGSSSLGSTFLSTPPDEAAIAPLLRERGARFVPALRSAAVRSVRACARPQSVDGRPLLGAVPGFDRLYIATGHGPWGISVGPACSRLVTELILGSGDAVPAAVSADRFGGIDGHPT